MDTVKTSYDNVNVLSLLEQVMTADRTSIGRSLVKLYLSQGMIVDLLDLLTKTEVINTGLFTLYIYYKQQYGDMFYMI